MALPALIESADVGMGFFSSSSPAAPSESSLDDPVVREKPATATTTHRMNARRIMGPGLSRVRNVQFTVACQILQDRAAFADSRSDLKARKQVAAYRKQHDDKRSQDANVHDEAEVRRADERSPNAVDAVRQRIDARHEPNRSRQTRERKEGAGQEEQRHHQ